MADIKTVLSVFPPEYAGMLGKALSVQNLEYYEIRLIAGRQIFLSTSDGIRFVNGDGSLSRLPSCFAPLVTRELIDEITDRATGYSSYAYPDFLADGFITCRGGMRIGMAFSESTGKNGTGDLNSLNIRLPYTGKMPDVKELDGMFSSADSGLLIAGAPGSGKTTLLRACAKSYCEKGKKGYRRVSVIDERGELYGGGCFDLGCCTDVISGIKKADGLMRALRLFSPDVLICDEIGGEEETSGLLAALNSGVILAASIHAGDIFQLFRRRQFIRLFNEGIFGHIVFLSSEEKGKIEKIYSSGEVFDEVRGCGGFGGIGDPDFGGLYCGGEKTSEASFHAV